MSSYKVIAILIAYILVVFQTRHRIGFLRFVGGVIVTDKRVAHAQARLYNLSLVVRVVKHNNINIYTTFKWKTKWRT